MFENCILYCTSILGPNTMSPKTMTFYTSLFMPKYTPNEPLFLYFSPILHLYALYFFISFSVFHPSMTSAEISSPSIRGGGGG
jgi:hypothetical protein